jgi:hypothetical protein
MLDWYILGVNLSGRHEGSMLHQKKSVGSTVTKHADFYTHVSRNDHQSSLNKNSNVMANFDMD